MGKSSNFVRAVNGESPLIRRQTTLEWPFEECDVKNRGACPCRCPTGCPSPASAVAAAVTCLASGPDTEPKRNPIHTANSWTNAQFKTYSRRKRLPFTRPFSPLARHGYEICDRHVSESQKLQKWALLSRVATHPKFWNNVSCVRCRLATTLLAGVAMAMAFQYRRWCIDFFVGIYHSSFLLVRWYHSHKF